MDVLKDLAENFSERVNLKRYHYSLERFDSEISDVLYTIRKEDEKLRFLGYLKEAYETSYQEHIKECKDPNTCSENRPYEIALYCINQVYDELFKELGPISTSEKPAMYYFAEGQYFDAYNSLRECVKHANDSIILIDGYVSEE